MDNQVSHTLHLELGVLLMDLVSQCTALSLNPDMGVAKKTVLWGPTPL